jgi:hypothetical protein
MRVGAARPSLGFPRSVGDEADGRANWGDAMGQLDAKLDKAYEEKTLAELAAAPVDALAGVSASDAEHLKAAFGIKTIGDLGTNKYFLWAQAIAKLAE